MPQSPTVQGTGSQDCESRRNQERWHKEKIVENHYEYLLFNISKAFFTQCVPNLTYGFLIPLSLFPISHPCINKGSILHPAAWARSLRIAVNTFLSFPTPAAAHCQVHWLSYLMRLFCICIFLLLSGAKLDSKLWASSTYTWVSRILTGFIASFPCLPPVNYWYTKTNVWAP